MIPGHRYPLKDLAYKDAAVLLSGSGSTLLGARCCNGIHPVRVSDVVPGFAH